MSGGVFDSGSTGTSPFGAGPFGGGPFGASAFGAATSAAPVDAMVRIRDLSQRLIETQRDAASLCLDICEAAVDGLTRQQQQAARETGHGWIASLADAHGHLARELTRLCVEAGREALD
jgi:hypothetical protein